MKIIEDRDLIYDVKDYDIVLVGLNIMNTMGNGFPHKVAVSFKNVARSNKETAYGDPKKLGTVKVIKGEPTFCLCYISRGRYRPDRIPDTVDYEALASCLSLINKNLPGLKVATTIIGHSEFEGGGDRERILKLLEEKLTDVDLYPGNYDSSIRRQIFANPPQLFISGHSHILKVKYDKTLGLLHINPGAAGLQGWHKERTLIRLTIDGQQFKDLEVITLGNK